jgi:hypothetical protein
MAKTRTPDGLLHKLRDVGIAKTVLKPFPLGGPSGALVP